MKKESVSAGELLSLIPDEFYQAITDELAVDKWVPKLKATFLFKLLVFSLLQSKELSLRVIEENSNDPFFQHLGTDLFEPVSYGAIRARLIEVKVEYFQKLYEFVYKELAAKYSTKQLKKYHLKRYDSTMVAVFAHLLDGMKVGNSTKNKRQVKFTTELTDSFLVKVRFFKDQKHLSEHNALKEVIESSAHRKSEVVTFDSGLHCRKTLKGFSEKRIKFVTRGRSNINYKVIDTVTPSDKLQVKDGLEFRQDSLVHLYATGGEEIKEPFRLIEAVRLKENKSIYFLTNIMDLEPQEIASIYKQRWDIEVFFRFMKQEMNLTHFVCNDDNAIQVMLYCTLIASMLLLVYKELNRIDSFKIAKIRFFKELHIEIIAELLEHHDGIKWLKKFNRFRLQRK